MTYDKEFEEMLNRVLGVCTTYEKNMVYLGWTEARKDHYRIGESAQGSIDGEKWLPVTIVAKGNSDGFLNEPQKVRRIPAKSRIDEISEEAAKKNICIDGVCVFSPSMLKDLIKSAILRAMEEKEPN